MLLSPSDRAARPVIAALGVTQIIGYGSFYYAYAVLAPQVAAEFKVSEPAVFAVLSIGLFLGGMIAPAFGHWMDRFGAPLAMSAGSAMMALLLAAIAFAPGFWAFAVLVVVVEVLSFTVLYDAAFIALARYAPNNTRAAITSLTLIAGFASTIFWPLTGWLAEVAGWRNTYLLFAAMHLAVALPLHLWISRRHPAALVARVQAGGEPGPGKWLLDGPVARRAFWLLGISFALSGMAMSAIGVHMVPVLLDRGLGDTAYLVAMAMGPAQVLVRVVDATLWRNRHPVTVAVYSAAAVPVALAMLMIPGPEVLFATAFAVLLGAGGGLSSIVRGAVPVALFGAGGLGLRLGQLAAMRTTLGAAAPFLFALMAAGVGTFATLGALLGVGAAGLAVMLWLWLEIRQAAPAVMPAEAAPPPTS